MGTTTVTEARATLPDIVERVLNGEEVTLTRHGVAVAVLVHPNRIRAPRVQSVLAEAASLRSLLNEAKGHSLGPGEGISAERAEELVADCIRGHNATLVIQAATVPQQPREVIR